jgi:pimeloyl-ACP methyl ester carboxylesterase
VAEAEMDALQRPGALTAALNWYRGMPFSNPRQAAKLVTVPTLYVWSDNDIALKDKCARLCADYVVADYRFEVLEGASHWLLEERPETVADLILDRIGGHSSAQGQRSKPGMES